MYRPKMFDFTLIAHAFYSYPFLELSRNKKFLYCLISNFCWTSDSFRISLIDASYISMHLRYIHLIISKNRYDLVILTWYMFDKMHISKLHYLQTLLHYIYYLLMKLHLFDFGRIILRNNRWIL